MAVSLDELMANNTPQPWTRGAAPSIYDLFAGHAPAKQAGYTQGLRLASLLEGARRKRDENLAYAGMSPQALEAAGVDAARAPLISSILRTRQNPDSLARSQLDVHRLAQLKHLADAATTAGYTPAQADLFSTMIGANGGQNVANDTKGFMGAQIPLAGTAAVPQPETQLLHAMGIGTTKEGGGTLYGAFAAPGAQTAVATPEGAAQAKADIASAAQRNAHARVYDAQADAGGFNPNTGSYAGAQPTPWNASGKDVATMAALYGGKPLANDSASMFRNAASDDQAQAAKHAAAQAAAQTAVYRILAAHPEIHSVAQFVEYLHQAVGSPVNPIPTAGTMSLPAAFGASPGVGDGTASPAAAPAPAAPRIAVNPQTGAKVVWNGSAWVPYDG